MAEGLVGKLVVELDFDGTRFEKGISAAKRELNSYGKSVQTSTQWAKDSNYAMDASRVALGNMKVQYQAMNATKREYLQLMQKEVDAGNRGGAAYARYSRQVNNLNNDMYKLNQEYIEMQKQSLIANSSFTKMGDFMNSAGDKMQSFGKGMTQVGQTLTQIGAVATAGGAMFVKQAVDFEKGLVAVQKTTNASSQEMKVLEKDIRELARTMPIAHGELTALASVAGQLGIKQQDIAEFTRTMAMMGTATNLSAVEASEALARFTNISGTGVSTIENLGAAIVHLGNNFATSESEIVNMAMGLVGTLSSIGVAEADILGISAAMSSLGITAERGGSSVSKFFVEMTTAANEGGESLAQFSEVAGMTNEAFGNLVKNDPSKAFTSFIEGLAKINDEGGSVVQTLDDMGIKEIRLRDTILRLVQGHEVLNRALGESNSAFQEGTALINEYNLMASTTASQWEIAKNQFRDVAISIGQALLPAIIEVLGQSSGLIDMAKSAADWFTGLSDGTKQAIVQFGAFTPIVGGVITALGQLITSGGTILKLGGSILKGLGQFSGLSKLMGLTDLEGNLIKVGFSMSSLINPTTLAVAALAGIGTYAYMATEDLRKMDQAIRDFPDLPEITLPQAESLWAMSDSLNAINTEISLMDGANIATVAESMGTLGTEISNLNNEKIQRLKEDFESLPQSVQEGLRDSLQATIQNIEEQTSRVQEIMNRMNEISKHAFDENGQMYESYITEMQLLSDEMMSYYSFALSETAEEQVKIYEHLTRNLSELTLNELDTREQYLQQAFDKEVELYRSQQEKLYNLKKESQGEMSNELYHKAQEDLERAHNVRMMAIKQELAKTEIENRRRVFEKTGEVLNDEHHLWREVLQQIAEETGLTFEQIEQIASSTDLSQGFRNMSEEAKKAYSTLITAMNTFAEQKGISPDSLGTEHVAEFIEYAKAAGLTWKDIELLSKDANIDSNTREFLEEVLEATTEWQRMTFDEKVAKLETEGAEALKSFIQEIEMWNALTPEQQLAILQTIEEGGRLSDKLAELGLWNELTLEEKLAIVATEGHESLSALLDEYGVWEHVPNEETKQAILDAITNGTIDVEAFINTWQGTEFQKKVAEIEGQADVGNAVGTFVAYWLLSVLTLKDKTTEIKANDLATTPTQGAIDIVNEFGDLTPNVPLEATDGASDTVSSVQKVVDDLGNSKPNTVLAATDNASRPINDVQRKADKLGASTPTPTLKASDNASSTIYNVSSLITRLDGRRADTYVYTHYRTTGNRAYSGTNRHVGGPLILGDGGRQEPFLTPGGHFGVSPATDTVYNLPYGTKVWSSIGRFKQEASDSPYLASFLDRLPHFATGTKQSFLDDLTTINLPVKLDDFGRREINQSGDSMVFNIDLSVIGNSLSRSQADKIIEPVIQAAERYSRKSRTKVNLGGVS